SVTSRNVVTTAAAASWWNRATEPPERDAWEGLGERRHSTPPPQWSSLARISCRGKLAKARDKAAPRTLSGMRLSPPVTVACALALVAGCAIGGTASPSPSTTAASGSCPTAPDAGTPQGWGQPATPPGVLPYLINSAGEMTCGPNRLLFVFLD